MQLPSRGFGPEAKPRGGIIRVPAYSIRINIQEQSRFSHNRRVRWYRELETTRASGHRELK